MSTKKALSRDLTATELANRLDPPKDTHEAPRCSKLSRLLFSASLVVGLAAGARSASAEVQILDTTTGSPQDAARLGFESGFITGQQGGQLQTTANTGDAAWDKAFNDAWQNGFKTGGSDVGVSVRSDLAAAFARGYYDAYFGTLNGTAGSVIVSPYDAGELSDAYVSGWGYGYGWATSSTTVASLDTEPNAELGTWDVVLQTTFADSQDAYAAGQKLGTMFVSLGDSYDSVTADTGVAADDAAFGDGYDTTDPGCASCASCGSCRACSSCSSCSCSCSLCGCGCGCA